jgi:hypothetical protein
MHWYNLCWSQMKRVMDNLGQFYGGRERIIIRQGGARGADGLAKDWVDWVGGIKMQEYLPNWEKYGKSAGMVRNAEMAKGADVLVAFWDGQSKGTKGMIDIAIKQGLETHVYRYSPAP